jgi:hypothetical protein
MFTVPSTSVFPPNGTLTLTSPGGVQVPNTPTAAFTALTAPSTPFLPPPGEPAPTTPGTVAAFMVPISHGWPASGPRVPNTPPFALTAFTAPSTPFLPPSGEPAPTTPGAVHGLFAPSAVGGARVPFPPAAARMAPNTPFFPPADEPVPTTPLGAVTSFGLVMVPRTPDFSPTGEPAPTTPVVVFESRLPPSSVFYKALGRVRSEP